MMTKQINKPFFTESDHSYVNPVTGQVYTSVTTFLHKFEPEKDWYSIASKYAKKNGETPEYWIAKWKEVNKEACDNGTKYHAEKESLDVSNGAFSKEDNLEIEDLYLLPDGVHTELLIWSDEYGIAGQSDKVIIKTVGQERFVWIEDYKTNKEIKAYNYIDKRTGAKIVNENLLAPLNNYCNCNYWLYQLQLNMYGYLLTKFGFTFAGGKIIHVTDNDKQYPLKNLQKEITDILCKQKS